MAFILLLFCTMLLSTKAIALPLAGEYELVLIPANETSFRAEYYFDKTGKPQGGIVLIFNSENQHLAYNIAHVLSQYGWATLITSANVQTLAQTIAQTIEPTNQETEKEKLATSTSTSTSILGDIKTSATGQTEPDDKMPELRESEVNPLTMEDQLNAAISFMQMEKNMFNLVLMSADPSWQGISDYLKIDNGSREDSEDINGLILLNAPHSVEIQHLSPELFILDLNTRRLVPSSFKTRKTESKRYHFQRYQQLNLHMSFPQNKFGENKLSKRIRGWLEINIHGMVVSKPS